MNIFETICKDRIKDTIQFISQFTNKDINFLYKEWNKLNPDFKLEKDIEKLIDENGSLVYVIRNWISNELSNKLLNLCNDIEWLSEKTIMGDEAKSRKIYAIGNNGLVHKYSKQRLELKGWSSELGKELKLLMDKINEKILKESNEKDKFTSCLLNKYETGDNYLGYHSDKDALGYNNAVCTISIGESRDILFKNIKTGEMRKIELRNSDLCLMFGKCQDQWKHSIPKRKNKKLRISITYRCIK